MSKFVSFPSVCFLSNLSVTFDKVLLFLNILMSDFIQQFKLRAKETGLHFDF